MDVYYFDKYRMELVTFFSDGIYPKEKILEEHSNYF